MLFKVSKEDLAKSRKRFYWTGGLMLLLGFLSLSMPLLASFAIETLVGAMLLGVAVCQGANAFKGFGEGDRPWQSVFMAVISFAASMIFFFNPLAGVMTLSVLLSVYFLVDGVTRVAEYFRLSGVKGSGWVLLSGALSIILAFMMWKNFFTGAAVIGVILGINLIFTGVSLILLGRGCSEAEKGCGE